MPPPPILGKRTRSHDSTTPSRYAKRQIQPEIFDDKNATPFTRFTRSARKNVDSMALDKLAQVTPIKEKHTAEIRVTVPGRSSITGHFGVAKAGTLKEPAKQVPDENVAEEDAPSKNIQLRTPQTPRFRDALAKKAFFTPRHRVTFTGKPMTPQTPRTPTAPGSSIVTIYGAARKLFTRSGDPGRLVGREEERKELTEFVQNCIENTSGGCTYVSGPPGTGKSALVNEVMENFEGSSTLKKVYINCMSMKTSKDLYASLLESFCEDEEILAGQEVKTLQGLFLPRKKAQTSYLVTLDEIDHILTLDLESLYKLFEWSLQKNSNLSLIGIANALDLTDRFLPRLKARNLKPQLLPFLPYNAANIKAVITTRLKSLLPPDTSIPDYIPFIHPAAIELLSRKVSSQTGDLRKAFDICRRAIDLIESETKQKHHQALTNDLKPPTPSKQPLGENINLSSPISPVRKVLSKSLPSWSPPPKSLATSLSALTPETAPRASISHITSLTSTTLASSSTHRLKSLNLQQKAALCSLIALEKRTRQRIETLSILSTPSKSMSREENQAPSIKRLYECYKGLCSRESVLSPLSRGEFREVIGSLEGLGLVGGVVVKGRGGRGGLFSSSAGGVGDERRVVACVGESEVVKMGVLVGVGGEILTSILEGDALD